MFSIACVGTEAEQCKEKKKIKASITGATQRRILNHRLWGKLLTTCSNSTEVADWQLLVVVDLSQLRIMASETVDIIDSPPFREQYLLSANCAVEMRAIYKSIFRIRWFILNGEKCSEQESIYCQSWNTYGAE